MIHFPKGTPPSIQFIVQKMDNDHNSLNELNILIKATVAAIVQKTQHYSSFCDGYQIPDGISARLIKIYGVPERVLMKEFESLNFVQNRMFLDIYYQTLLVSYFIGVIKNDIKLKMYSLYLINIKLYNGRKFKFFPQGCDKEVMEYVIQNKLTAASILKKYGNINKMLLEYFAGTIDNTYGPRVLVNASALYDVFKQSWDRIQQMFKIVAQKYYESFKNNERIKSVSSSEHVVDDRGGSIDSKQTLNSDDAIQAALSQKLSKNMMLNPKALTQQQKQYLTQKLLLSADSTEKLDLYFRNKNNINAIENALNLVLRITKIKSQDHLCALHVVRSADKILSFQDAYSTELKKRIDAETEDLFSFKSNQVSLSIIQRVRKVYLLVLLLKTKEVSCGTSSSNQNRSKVINFETHDF